MKDIKKELIIALKYVCPKLGYGFLGLGIALLLTQPGKMADILFSVAGVGLLGFTLGALLFYVIGDLGCNHRYAKRNEKLAAKVKTLEEQNQKLRKIIANGANPLSKTQTPTKLVVPSEISSTQPKKPLFDFEETYEDTSMEEKPIEEADEEPAEEVADEQILEPAEKEKTDLQESSES